MSKTDCRPAPHSARARPARRDRSCSFAQNRARFRRRPAQTGQCWFHRPKRGRQRDRPRPRTAVSPRPRRPAVSSRAQGASRAPVGRNLRGLGCNPVGRAGAAQRLNWNECRIHGRGTSEPAVPSRPARSRLFGHERSHPPADGQLVCRRRLNALRQRRRGAGPGPGPGPAFAVSRKSSSALICRYCRRVSERALASESRM